MIVYNVGRQWFTMKNDANRHRVSEGLPPAALATIEVKGRDDLAALLNALCEPPAETPDVIGQDVIDRAYVPVETDVPDFIPDFLVKAWRG